MNEAQKNEAIKHLERLAIMTAFYTARSRVARRHYTGVDDRSFKLNIPKARKHDKSIPKTANAGRGHTNIAKKISKKWKTVNLNDTSRTVTQKALVTSLLLLADHKKQKIFIVDILMATSPEMLDNLWRMNTNSSLAREAVNIYSSLARKTPLPARSPKPSKNT